jgi:2-keto-4-pentenoate hydratase
MQRALIPPGGTASLAGWVKPVAEPEIAVHIGRDLPGGGDRAAAAAAIAALGPAIELADADLPFEDPEAILKGNIFQRHVILGERDASRAGGSTTGLTARVFRREAEVARTSDPEAATGKLVDIVRHVADLLAAFGEKLSAGDVIIAGSVVPPMLVEADETGVAFALEPIGRVSVAFTR